MNKNSSSSTTALDLTQRPPRSLRCRLGGYAILPRLLDKCRALNAGTIGEYHSNCPLDRQFFEFVDIDAAALETELAQGRTDSQMLQWVQTHAGKKREVWEIEAWSSYQDDRGPTSDPGTAGFFSGLKQSIAPERADVRSWADLLDLDDHCSFGGTA